MSEPEVRSFLTVSMSHLPESFADTKLQNCFDPTGDAAFCGSYGTLLYAPGKEDEVSDETYIADRVAGGTPESVAKLLLYARKELGCSYVLFDRDGDELEGFVTYEGDEPFDEEADRFTNFYRCPDDGTKWTDTSPSTNNDRCPKCRAEIEPYKSEDL